MLCESNRGKLYLCVLISLKRKNFGTENIFKLKVLVKVWELMSLRKTVYFNKLAWKWAAP